MRVLFLTHAFPRFATDPVGSFVLRLAVALRSEDVAVTVLAPSGQGLVADEMFEGIPVHRFRYAPRASETLAYTGTMSVQARESWGGRLALAGLLASTVTAGARLARRAQIDLVHAHWWFPSGLAGRGIGGLMNRPLVITSHGSDIRLARDVPGGQRLFRYVTRGARVFTTVSSWLARQALALDANAQPIVAPMPVLSDLFRPGGTRDHNRLLFVGKLTEQKGLHHLLRALPLMRRQPIVDVVGAGRVDDVELRDLATELGVAERIRWLPILTQAELAPLYQRATIHVIPAIDEGLGLTAVESLMCETPVVAFDSGGVPDVVISGLSGVLVPPGDYGALATALDSLLDQPAERARLGAQGRNHVVARFGSAAVARHYASLYRQALTITGRDG
jgi:glycosyltransferase involved in cell wall biosynthesis